MDFICKDAYGRDVYREDAGLEGYLYRVQLGGVDVLTLTLPRSTPIATVLVAVEGMRTGLGSVEQARDILKARVNEMRMERMYAPVSYKGDGYDADEFARGNLHETISAILAGLPPTPVWRTIDNKTVPVVLADLMALAQIFSDRKTGCMARSWELKAQLDVAADPTTVDLNTGWPA